MLYKFDVLYRVAWHRDIAYVASEFRTTAAEIMNTLREIEKEIGTPLFHYGRAELSLTPAGRKYLKCTEALNAAYERLCREIREESRQDESGLRIGWNALCVGNEYRRAAAKLAQIIPDAETDVSVRGHAELSDMLLHGQLDVIITSRRENGEGFTCQRIAKTECAAEISQENRLSKYKTLTAKQLRYLPCLAVASIGTQAQEEEYLRSRYGIESGFEFHETAAEARRAAASGRGYFIAVGGKIPENFCRSLIRLPLTDGGRPVLEEICAIYRDGNGKVELIRAFCDMIADEFRRERLGAEEEELEEE